MIELVSEIQHDEYTEIAERYFDIPHQDKSVVQIEDNLDLPDDWSIGLIYGPSGCGKSTILKKHFGGDDLSRVKWDNSKAMISNFTSVSPEEAQKILCAVGFNTIPSWLRPFSVLSNGEQFRANIARVIADTKTDVISVDEFTSVVDRNVAKAISNSLYKYIQKSNKKIVLASCHTDIIDWLRPDWIYNPVEGITKITRGLLQRPKITLKICRVEYSIWELFKKHHYLSNDLNNSARCFCAFWDGIPVVFIAILAQPSGTMKNAWRDTRIVTLPDYQGLGLGTAVNNFLASCVVGDGKSSFYLRTVHPAMIHSCLTSPKWKESTHSRVIHDWVGSPPNSTKKWKIDTRYCYSFKYIGEPATLEDSILFHGESLQQPEKTIDLFF